MSRNLVRCLNDLYYTIIDSIRGENVIVNKVKLVNNLMVVENDGKVFKMDLTGKYLLILGAGKATLDLTIGFLKVIDAHNRNHNSIKIRKGAIILPHGSKVKQSLLEKYNISIYFGGINNLPDADSLDATNKLLDIVDEYSINSVDKTPAVFLTFISGGASALLVSPNSSLTLAQKLDITKRLMSKGYTIKELNRVRKHLSLVKGGQLASRALQDSPWCEMVSFIASDVIGDDISTIGSGPTCYLEKDSSSEQFARKVLQDIDSKGEFSNLLLRNEKPYVDFCNRLHNLVILNNSFALNIAKAKAKELGFKVEDLGNVIQGESINIGARLAQLAMISDSNQNICWIGGGETTVKMDHPDQGSGGRCQELALKFLIDTFYQRDPKIAIMAAGTDGQDGPTPVAGVIYQCPKSLSNESNLLELAISHLERHDSYTFWSKYFPNSLLNTNGPTGVNVMDIYCVLKATGPNGSDM